jgi:hypothetical protein
MWATPLLIPAALVGTLTIVVAGEEQPGVDIIAIIAAAVRDRGFACDRPDSAERDAAASLPDRKAWIIRCEDSRYRVIFEGDTGPRVTPLGRSPQRQ